ncbi:MAG: hypothetical protein U0T02_05850 [Solirubrobacteraceae bacterium]
MRQTRTPLSSTRSRAILAALAAVVALGVLAATQLGAGAEPRGMFAGQARLTAMHTGAGAPARPAAGRPAAPSASGPASVSTRSTRYGRILTDARGFALYLFTRDGRGASRCYGACARAWPPLLTRRSRPTAGGRAQASKVGTVRRAGGRLQVTYRGQPLYYYVGDTRPAVVLCQGVEEFGGLWWVVSPRGYAIR